MPSSSGESWLGIRVKTEKENFNAVRSKIISWPEEVMATVYKPQLIAIADEAVGYIRHIIATETTPTGERRKEERGGEAGRIETGKMRDAVKKRVRSSEGKRQRFAIFVGWIDGKPGYSIFQEQGTSNGVKAMNSIGQAQEFMISEIRRLSSGSFTASNIGFNDGEGDGN
jgi:hypothetical protein